MKYKYLFGPVPSRRLGLSLGVDIVPMKTCTLSCVYCQIGKTRHTTVERREYVPVEEIISELQMFFDSGGETDWVTFSGSGEPTLNSCIGEMIHRTKEITNTPVCVITNGTLLWDPTVRKDIAGADAVMPSLDSVVAETFNKVCNPHPSINPDMIVNGLEAFRKEYTGSIWLEIMLVEGVNDNITELASLRDAVERIQPDAVQLNTVARPPAESWAKPLSRKRMEEIREFFGDNAEIIASFNRQQRKTGVSGDDDVREYLKRRPGTLEDIVVSLGIGKDVAEQILLRLTESGEIIERTHYGKRFWEYRTERDL